MKDSALRLQDKTILLAGPFNGITQAILRTMTEFGADVGFVSDKAGHASKFIDSVNEARDVHSHYGRAALIDLPMGTDAQIQEALSRTVSTVGRMDVLIDATPLNWNAQTISESVKHSSMNLAERIVPFFLAKQRGRLIYIFEDPSLDGLRENGITPGCRDVVHGLVETLAKKYRGQNVTINALTVGVTDDLLLRVYPQIPSLKRAFEELAKSHPGSKLVDFNDIGLGSAYLASALSASLTGQTLRLTHGFHL